MTNNSLMSNIVNIIDVLEVAYYEESFSIGCKLSK